MLAMQAVINQTKKVDKLVLFDDTDNPRDLRQMANYQFLFDIMNCKGIAWEVVYARRQGQHHNHQMANSMGFEWVWRVDDDCIPEQNVLETLFSHIGHRVGAIAGSIYTPGHIFNATATGKIENIDKEPSLQWGPITKITHVDHLHCSFLYRAGVYDYNLGLSRVAHREETLFTFGLSKLGYDVIVVPGAITWHNRHPEGGIRSENRQEPFDHDEAIFRNFLKYKDRTIVILDNGMGDHVVFKKVLPLLKDPLVFSCYPDIIPGQSIAEAKMLFGDIEHYSIYKKMDSWQWQGSLENAFRKLYLGANL
jgi:hypothetical protein